MTSHAMRKEEQAKNTILSEANRQKVASWEEREAILLSRLVSFLRRDGRGWLRLDPRVQCRGTDN